MSETSLQNAYDRIEELELKLESAKERIKRLEEAGDRMRLYCADPDDCFAWDKARKDNP